jgi:dTDP-4-dehydrorhamnose reductase
MKSLKIWITGAGGMLGQDLTRLAREAGHTCLLTDLDVDITSESAVTEFLKKNTPDRLVNCAAYTAVDKAESDQKLNYHVNAEGPKNLGECCARAGVPLLHISTDYVMSGNPPKPLEPDNPYNPMNAYGSAKAEGEKFLRASGARFWVVRTAWLYGIHGKNFVKTMLRLMHEKESLAVVNDQFGNPTWTEDLSRAILKILETNDHYGFYHFTGEGITTWHDFTEEIQNQAFELGLVTRKIPVAGVPSDKFPSAAKRPAWSALSKDKIKATFGVTVPRWQDSLHAYLELEKKALA